MRDQLDPQSNTPVPKLRGQGPQIGQAESDNADGLGWLIHLSGSQHLKLFALTEQRVRRIALDERSVRVPDWFSAAGKATPA